MMRGTAMTPKTNRRNKLGIVRTNDCGSGDSMCDGPGCTVPSFRHLLHQIGERLDTKGRDFKPQWDLNDSNGSKDFVGSSGSTISPSCSSTISLETDCNAPTPERERSCCKSRKDFWRTVLGPSPTVVKTQRKGQLSDFHVKPHGCPKCPLRFKKRCNLQSHMRSVHEKLRPFGCGVCLRKFGRKSNCAKHVSLPFEFSGFRFTAPS